MTAPTTPSADYVSVLREAFCTYMACPTVRNYDALLEVIPNVCDITVSRLCLQIGDKGQAVLSNAARPAPIGAVAPDESRALYTPDNWQVRDWALEEAALACENERVEEVGESDISYNFAIKHASDAIRALSAAPAAPIAPSIEHLAPSIAEHAKPEPVEPCTLRDGTGALDVLEGMGSICPHCNRSGKEPVEQVKQAEGAATGCECGQTHEWCKANDCPDLSAAVKAGQQSVAVDGAPSTNSAAEGRKGCRDAHNLILNCRKLMAEKQMDKAANWVIACELFAVGSTTAMAICREANIDPQAYTMEKLAMKPEGDTK